MNIREIKFRGKRLDNGEWIYGNLVIDSDGKRAEIWDYASFKSKNGAFTYKEVDIKTVGQFIGLEDKNKKEIFQGDIFIAGDPEIQYEVKYIGCQFVGNQIGNKSLFGIDFHKEHVEIVGNIHENSELKLKSK